jgi:hypothetical protein
MASQKLSAGFRQPRVFVAPLPLAGFAGLDGTLSLFLPGSMLVVGKNQKTIKSIDRELPDSFLS